MTLSVFTCVNDLLSLHGEDMETLSSLQLSTRCHHLILRYHGHRTPLKKEVTLQYGLMKDFGGVVITPATSAPRRP